MGDSCGFDWIFSLVDLFGTLVHFSHCPRVGRGSKKLGVKVNVGGRLEYSLGLSLGRSSRKGFEDTVSLVVFIILLVIRKFIDLNPNNPSLSLTLLKDRV